MTTDYGHWSVKGFFEPNDYVGFIYQITNRVTGQSYIGKKNFRSIKHIKSGNQIIERVSESDWRRYKGSSPTLKTLIEQSPDDWSYTILSLHDSATSLDYREMELQFELDIFRATLPDGTPAYINRAIGHAVRKSPFI